MVRSTLTFAVILLSLGLPVLAAGQSTPKHTIFLFVTTGQGTHAGTILITGAVADYGHTLDVNGLGRPDASGGFVKAILRGARSRSTQRGSPRKLPPKHPRSIARTARSGSPSRDPLRFWRARGSTSQSVVSSRSQSPLQG